MGRIAISTAVLATFVLALGLSGCSSKAPDSSSAPPIGQPTEDHSEHADHSHGEHANHEGGRSNMEKMKAELAKLSPEDAASAEKQHGDQSSSSDASDSSVIRYELSVERYLEAAHEWQTQPS